MNLKLISTKSDYIGDAYYYSIRDKHGRLISDYCGGESYEDCMRRIQTANPSLERGNVNLVATGLKWSFIYQELCYG